MKRGYHYIALFEVLKGFAALIVAFGFFDIVKQNKIFLLTDFISHAEPPSFKDFLTHMFGQIKSLGPRSAELVLLFGLLYAGFRLLEGYGLWKEKNWGRKVGICSAGLYLPFEFAEILHEVTLMKVTITIVNVLVILYLWRTHVEENPRGSRGGEDI